MAGATPIEYVKNSAFFNGAEALPKVALLDDFEWRDMPMTTFLKISERYVMLVPATNDSGAAPGII